MFENIPPLYWSIIFGALGATVWNILGFKAFKEKDENWSLEKYAWTLLTGIIGGALLGWFLELDPKASFFTAFCTDVSRNMLKDIFQSKPG